MGSVVAITLFKGELERLVGYYTVVKLNVAAKGDKLCETPR